MTISSATHEPAEDRADSRAVAVGLARGGRWARSPSGTEEFSRFGESTRVGFDVLRDGRPMAGERPRAMRIDRVMARTAAAPFDGAVAA